MLQDIYPKKFDNSYDPNAVINYDDYVLIYEKGELVFKNERRELFRYSDTKDFLGNIKYTYLFRIDDKRFFLAAGADVKDYTVRIKSVKLRYFEPQWIAYAGSCGASLAYWYKHTRYCGSCGSKNVHSKTERAMVCPRCNNRQYPIISPAVIVALTDKDRILLIKYAHGPYKKYALIAGYTEIGETVEETVRREVMEETGLKVKNIKYFGSQPWPFSGSVLMGYWAELDGSDKIHLDETELCEAVWKHRSELEKDENTQSLTNTMIQMFRDKECK